MPIATLDILQQALKYKRRRVSEISITTLSSDAQDAKRMAKRKRKNEGFHPLNALLGARMSSFRNLRDFLKKKSRVMAFRDFLRTEFSEENLDFWTEVETYKKQKSSKQCKLAPLIYQTYIEVGAPREINIDSLTRDDTAAKLAHPDSETFSSAQSHVFSLMERDAFRRFLQKGLHREMPSKVTISKEQDLEKPICVATCIAPPSNVIKSNIGFKRMRKSST